MRAVVTAVIAAIEAAAVALAGLALVVVPALLVWIITFDFAAEPTSVFSGSLGVWFLAHFVPIGFEILPEAAVGLGLPQQAFDYPLSLAPLGLTSVTVALAVRSGLRFGGRGGMGVAGVFGGMAGFGLMTAAVRPVAASLLEWSAAPSLLVPALVYGIAAAVGFVARAVSEQHEWWARVVRAVQQGAEKLGLPAPATLPDRVGTAVRLAAAAATTVILLAAVAVGTTIIAHYVQVVTLSQSLQLDPLGVLVMFVVQLTLLPVLVIWAAAWLTGAGFSLGIGTSVSPLETLLGPVPAVPVFGAVPSGWGSAGLLAPTLVVLAGVVVGAVFARRPMLRRASWPAVLSVAAVAAILVGLLFAGAGALASGGIGPDRLVEAGPDPWLFGGLAAAELCAGLMIGVAAGRIDTRHLAATLPLRREANGEASTGSQREHDDDLEQQTVPLDEVVKDLRVRTWRGTGSDRSSDNDGNTAAAVDAEASSEDLAAATPGGEAEAEHDADSASAHEDEQLLRAFSWDRRAEASDSDDFDAVVADEPGDPASGKRLGWPFRRPGS